MNSSRATQALRHSLPDIDRGSTISLRFKTILRNSGVEILLTAYQETNMNAYAERFVRSIRSECLDRMIFLVRESLECAIAEYVAHYHEERSHQGIGNDLINGEQAQREGVVDTMERLGGLLKYYHRRAA